MVETGLLLQHSDIIQYSPRGGGGSMHAQTVLSWHSLLPPQLFGTLSHASPGIYLSGLYKWLSNHHTGPGTPPLPALLYIGTWSFGLTSSCLRVGFGQKETLTPSGARTHHTASDRPRT